MLILFVALILAMIAFGIGLKIFENHMPEPVISEDGFLMDEQSEELADFIISFDCFNQFIINFFRITVKNTNPVQSRNLV